MKLFQKRSALENLPSGGYSEFQVTEGMEGFLIMGKYFFGTVLI